MKKLFMTMVGLVMMGVMATPAQAKVLMQETGTIMIEEDEVIDDDLYIAGEIVEIRGTVNGDVYVGAGVVRFSGKTTGDLIIGSGEVTVTGEVGDDLWIGAGNVYASNLVIGDGASIGAGSVTIDEDSSIGGSLLVGAGMLDNRASIGRNLMAGAGVIRHNNSVGGEVRVGGETIELGRKTNIARGLTYMTESELTLADGATVAGETRRVESQHPTPEERQMWRDETGKFWGTARIGMEVMSYLGAALVGAVVIWLMGDKTKKLAKTIEDNFAASMGWGLLIMVLAFPALLLLTVTGVGMPLAALLGLCLIIDLYLAKIWASMMIGTLLQKRFSWKKMSMVAVFLVGLTTYYVLRNVPVVGGLVRLAALLYGLGGSWMYLKSMKK